MDLTRFAETFAQGGTPLVRTDFGSDAAWQAVVAEVVKPVDYVDLSVSDPEDAELFDSFMGRTFRCVTSEVASIECNLSIDNMDFSDFADNTDPDGVFRGFGDG